MDYQVLFYILTIADNASVMLGWFCGIFTIWSVIATVLYLVASSGSVDSSNNTHEKLVAAEAAKQMRKWIWWSYPLAFLVWSLYILTPSKKDALLIVAGGTAMNFLTTDSSARKLPAELSGFLVTQIKSLAAESNVELAGLNVKAKLKDEAKKLTTEELLTKMKSDTTFAKIILE